MKRKRLSKLSPVKSNVDAQQLEEIYKIRALFADISYVSVVNRNKSTLIRLTFAERVSENTHRAVTSVILTPEDLQGLYNIITTTLENLRKLGRIE